MVLASDDVAHFPSRKYHVNLNIYIKNMNYIQLFEIPFLCFFYVLFVRIQWWLCQNPQRFCLFPQQFWKAGTVCEQGEARKNTTGNLQGFIFWSRVWSGPIIHVNAAMKSSSEARLGVDYPVPASVTDEVKILAGLQKFSPDEVEVFCLDSSP